MTFKSVVSKYTTFLLGGAALATVATVGAIAAEAQSTGPVTLRLTTAQYRQIISDVFGPTVNAGGRFDPDIRYAGLVALGAGRVSVTASGLEGYDAAARKVADQVVSKDHRATLIPCTPKSVTEPDDACARQFLGDVGKLLYRRPLAEAELAPRVAMAAESAKTAKDFYTGLATSLSTLLVSPQFLFRQDKLEADPAHPGQTRLDAYSKASKLSFFLWNAAPDPLLLKAADSGELHTAAGLAKQVDRMLASPRVEGGVRAYFTDMFGFQDLAYLGKDAALYPNFSVQVAQDAEEQTLRTMVDHLVTKKGDYRDIFTTRDTFLTPILGSIYNVPVAAPDGGWAPYKFPEGDPHNGIQMQVSFVALHSHPGRTSPTLRGKALREMILCQRVPDPPGNVNFTVVQDTANPLFKTARERLKAHATEAMCTGCHKITDPMGLAMENFDTAGSYRLHENGADIDASGELDAVKFQDAVGLGKALHDSPRASSCLVERMYTYALGRPLAPGENQITKGLGEKFAAAKYRVPELMRSIAVSETLFAVKPQTEEQKSAQLENVK